MKQSANTENAWTGLALKSGVLALLAVFFLLPILHVLRASVRDAGGWTSSYFQTIFRDPVILASLGNTLIVGLGSLVLGFVIALPLAWTFFRYDFPLKRSLSLFLLLPLMAPPFVGAIGLHRMLGRFGSVNLLLLKYSLVRHPIDFTGRGGLLAVIVMEALHMYPILYLAVWSALTNVDQEQEESAGILGASWFRVQWDIYRPLVSGAVAGGAVLVFLGAATDLGSPLVFGIHRVLPVQIFDRIQDLHTDHSGYALVVLVLLLTAFGVIAMQRTWSVQGFFGEGRGARRSREVKLDGVKAWLPPAWAVCVIGVAGLPHVGVLLAAFEKRWFMSILPESYTISNMCLIMRHPLSLSSIRNSLMLAIGATWLDILLAFAIAHLTIRHRGTWSALLDALAMLPIAVPGLVLAYGYLGLFGTPFFENTFLNPERSAIVALLLAYAIRRLPFMLRIVQAGYHSLGTSLEEASYTLSGSKPWTLFHITVPLLSASILAGAVLTFAFSIMEVSDSLILAVRTRDYPVAKAIYHFMGRLGDGPLIACAMGVAGMVLLLVSFALLGRLLARRGLDDGPGVRA